jgi:hypothetical protein
MPRILSSEQLTHSAPSIAPRSSAGTISPPGSVSGDAQLDVLELPDLLLEPPHRLRTFRMHLEADHIHLQLLRVSLLEQLVAAAFPVPAVVVDEVHAEQRPVGQRDERGQLSEDVPGRGVPRVEDAAAHRVLDLEGRNDRARGRHVDLEPSTRGLLDRRHQQLRGVVREYPQRPSGLHLPPHRSLGARGGRRGLASEEPTEGDQGDKDAGSDAGQEKSEGPLHRGTSLCRSGRLSESKGTGTRVAGF